MFKHKTLMIKRLNKLLIIMFIDKQTDNEYSSRLFRSNNLSVNQVRRTDSIPGGQAPTQGLKHYCTRRVLLGLGFHDFNSNLVDQT